MPLSPLPSLTSEVLDRNTNNFSQSWWQYFRRLDPVVRPVGTSNTALPYNYLGGLTLANDGISPNTVLDIAPGSAASDDNTSLMTLPTPWTKSTGGTFVAGSGGKGLDTGSVANAWYHVFLIQRPDTGATDILFSLSATSPTLPTGYTRKRRIGSFVVDVSLHIIPFTQFGDEFLWVTPRVTINGTVPTVGTLIPLSVPTGIKVLARLNGWFNDPTASGQLFMLCPETAGPTVGISISPASPFYDNVDTIIRTDTSGQVIWFANTTGASAAIQTTGWFDYRGK